MSHFSEKPDVIHNIVLENREKLSLTGVDDVSSFDENQIFAKTEMGYLSIKGSLLHINKFDIQNGELNVIGKIDELIYSSKKLKHLNFLEKIFR